MQLCIFILDFRIFLLQKFKHLARFIENGLVNDDGISTRVQLLLMEVIIMSGTACQCFALADKDRLTLKEGSVHAIKKY